MRSGHGSSWVHVQRVKNTRSLDTTGFLTRYSKLAEGYYNRPSQRPHSVI